MELYEKILEKTLEWRAQGYNCEKYPAIREILEHNRDESGQLRFLRLPQFEALEVYWYLRLKLDTPSFLKLYQNFYKKKSDLYKAFGIDIKNEDIADEIMDGGDLIEKLKSDTGFVKKNKLEAIHESINLAYPSYILALTMGAGKTLLISTIIATEFAMSLEYSDNGFMKNALVFAPDKTIINSLKEIADTPFELILPARHNRLFMANYKLIYTQDGSKTIDGVQDNSAYNIIVTNTQKIIPRKLQNKATQTILEFEEKQKQETLTANLRLQKIASLPSIGIFSDEAHHTYGQEVGADLKRVREAINYIGRETKIICVVNTTGTPYFGRQTLKDVVYWYGLDQGINDNILKSLSRSIITYDFSEQSEEDVIQDIINNFFTEYGEHKLLNGAEAKIAFYFKDSNHLAEGRKFIEKALIAVKKAPSLILQNTEKSSKHDIEEFNSLNDPSNKKRVILLIQKGTEGWNCPSLFATALIRELSSSNNYILQSSTRCLRQVVGNDKPARIYIESRNKNILDRQLEENFRTSLSKLSEGTQDYEEMLVEIRKPVTPKIKITRIICEVVPSNDNAGDIKITRPSVSAKDEKDVIYRSIYEPNLVGKGEFLQRFGEVQEIKIENNSLDIFSAAKDIAGRYHLSYLQAYDKLLALYPDREIPKNHITKLFSQIDSQRKNYKIVETQVEQELSIIKLHDEQGNEIFEKNTDGIYSFSARFEKGGDKNFLKAEDVTANKNDLGFHYSPYNFDSALEKEFLKEMLHSLNENPKDIHDIYFTGGLTNTSQTDLYFEYQDAAGRFRNYFPDFVILKKNGNFLIVEIKDKDKQQNTDLDTEAKKKAVLALEAINKDRFKYHILYTDTPITTAKVKEAEDLVRKI